MGKYFRMSGVPVNGRNRKDPKALSSSFVCEVYNTPEGLAIINVLKSIAKSRGQRLNLRGRHPGRMYLPRLLSNHDVPLVSALTIRVYFGKK